MCPVDALQGGCRGSSFSNFLLGGHMTQFVAQDRHSRFHPPPAILIEENRAARSQCTRALRFSNEAVGSVKAFGCFRENGSVSS